MAEQKEFMLCAKINMPEDAITERQYKVIKDCGINTVIIYAENIIPHLNAAEKYDIQVIYLNKRAENALNNYINNNDKTVFEIILSKIRNYQTHPVYRGEIISRYPDVSLFDSIQVLSDIYYGSTQDKIITAQIYLGEKNFENYLSKYIEKAKPKVILCDGIPHNDVDDGYYYNMDILRQKTTEANIPFYFTVQTNFDAKNILSTRAYLRWQTFIAAAFGAKGICYGNMYADNESGGILTAQGEKTWLYDYVTELNKEIIKTGTILRNAKCECINTDYETKFFRSPLKEYYPVKSIEGSGYIAGCFCSEKGRKKLLVTNILPNENASAVLKLSSGVAIANVCIGTSSFSISPKENKISVNINTGDAVLIEFENIV